MKIKLLTTLLFLICQIGIAQTASTLKGQIYFDNNVFSPVDVINSTTKTLTVADANGRFSIAAKPNDLVVFVSKNYEIKKITVSSTLLDQGFIKVTLNQKVEELKEVLINNIPSVKISKDTKWEQGKLDQLALQKAASALKNPGVYNGSIENGMNFMRIGKMILGIFKKEKDTIKKQDPSLPFIEAAKSKCNQDFFTETLQLKPEQIDDFLQFCDKDPKSKLISADQNVLTLMEFMSGKILYFIKKD